MAITTVADVGSLVNAEAIDTLITEYVFEDQVVIPSFRFKSLVGIPTNVASFPRRVKPAAPTTIATEATAMVPGIKTYTDVSLGMVRYGMALSISETAEEDNTLGTGIYSQEFIMDAARLWVELQDTLAAAQFSNATNSVGVTATALTVATMASALASQRVAKARGKHVYSLHDLQTKQLHAAQIAVTATPWQQFFAPNADLTSYAGTFFGNDIWSSASNPTANAAADRVGCLYPVGSTMGGNDAYAPFAYALKRAATTKNSEEILTDSKTLVTTMRFGVGTLAGAFATKIISQNS